MKKRQLSPLLVLLVFTIAGFAFGSLRYVIRFSLKNEPSVPREIGYFSQPALEIVAIVAPAPGETVPVIRLESGDLVADGYLADVNAYEQYTQVDSPCDPTYLTAITDAAGDVVDCKQGVAVTDFCPSDIRAYAITDNGAL